MAAAVFEFLLKPRGYQVEAFIKVGTLPLEIDIVVIRGPEATDQGFERLDFIFERLGPVTVIEFKGPTDELEIKDFDRLLAYSLLYRIKENIGQYSDITTMTISSRLTEGYKKALKAEGIVLKKERPGLFHGQGAMFRHFAVALDELPEGAQTLPLLPLGRRRKAQFAQLFRGDAQDIALGHYLWRMARENKELLMQFFTDEDLKKGIDEIRREMIGYLTAEDLIEVVDELTAEEQREFFGRLSLEQRRALFGKLTAEERLKGLGPDERLKGLGPEERLKGLGPEERLKGLGPEERLKGLGPEEILAALPEEVRRELEKKIRG